MANDETTAQEFSADSLREQWQGKNIRTERTVAQEEAARFLGVWAEEDWHPDYTWGGAGVATDFVERDGKVFVQNDEGMEWMIDERTTIVYNIRADQPATRSNDNTDVQ